MDERLADGMQFEQEDEFLRCTANGELTIEAAVRAAGRVLSLCAQGKYERVLVDISPIDKPLGASIKVMIGLKVGEAVQTFVAEHSWMPRVAVWGRPPLILSGHQPAREVFKSQGIPVDVFDTEEAALAWLLHPEPA